MRNQLRNRIKNDLISLLTLSPATMIVLEKRRGDN